MSFEKEYIYLTAKSMLHNSKELEPDLKARLDRVRELCENASGDLVSRQVIANIIMEYELSLKEVV
jgi:hypothetical protein